jgi:hypothetical protein
MPARRRVGAGDNVESAWSPSAPRVGIRVGTDPPHASTLALLFEVIAINLRHLHWPKRHGDLMLDHQLGESRPVYEHHPLNRRAKSTAWEVKPDVVMNTPLFARCRASAP